MAPPTGRRLGSVQALKSRSLGQVRSIGVIGAVARNALITGPSSRRFWDNPKPPKLEATLETLLRSPQARQCSEFGLNVLRCRRYRRAAALNVAAETLYGVARP